MSALDDLGPMLKKARKEIEERDEKIKEREERLSKALEGVDKEKRLMAGRKSDDVLNLNIGGTKCSVSRRTMCQYEDSLLAVNFQVVGTKASKRMLKASSSLTNQLSL